MKLLYFAWVRERIGLGEEVAEPPESVTTVDALIGWLAERGGGYAAAFAQRDRLRAAVDGVFVTLDVPLGEAREVALFPPVTGG